MKSRLSILYFLIQSSFVFSQAVTYRDFQDNTNTYAARDTFAEIMVADDFGPRDLGDDWHGGVDFNSTSDFGDMILAPETGTFVNINRLIRNTEQEIRYQILDVGTYRYVFLHMFDKHQNQQWYNDSTVYISNVLNRPDEWGMVILIGNDTIALGQVNNRRIIFNNDTLTVTNSVNQYDAIGLLGNSGQYRNSQGVWVDYDSHLHLHTLPDNRTSGGDAHNRNPCQHVHYADTTYNISIWSELNSDSVAIKYPGTSATKIAVRTQLNGGQLASKRYSHIMDVNKVIVNMKEVNQGSFEKIKGVEEESIITLGGRIGESILNHQRNNNYPGTIHQWAKTGVNSNAYNGDLSGPNARNPWDDYFFTDFISRIHEDDPRDGDTTATMIAHCPQDARYNDGKYLLYAEVVDVKDSIQYSDTLTFTLDNFKPFLKNISVDFGSRVVYNQAWTCSDSCVVLQDGIMNDEVRYSDINGGVAIRVASSEPLDTLRLSIEAWDIVNMTPSNIGNNRMYFEFEVDEERVNSGLTARFHFSGTDCSENTLLAMPPNTGCARIPTRNATGWNNPDGLTCGVDSIHFFYLACGAPTDSLLSKEDGNRFVSPGRIVTIIGEDCFAGSTIWSTTAASGPWVNDGAIDLSVNEDLGIGVVSYEWSNGATSQDIDQLLPGAYCVTIQDDFCCTSSHCITVEEDCPEFLFYYAEYVWACGGQNNGSLKVVPIEGIPPYTYHWSNGSTQATADGLATGWHSVTVVDAIGCQQEGSLYLSAKNININATQHLPCSKASRDGAIDLSISGNGRWPYTYEWSNGATTKDLSGLSSGQYCVTLTDADSCQQSACFDLTAELEVYVSSIQNPAFCEAGGTTCMGSIQLEVVSAIPYTVKWNGPDNYTASSEYITGLCPGQYNAIVTDTTGCTTTTFAVICCCRAFSEGGTVGINNQLCQIESNSEDRLLSIKHKVIPAFNGNNGSIDLQVMGGTGAQYFYAWSGPDGYEAFTQDLHQLKPGEYCVSITDGCAQKTACFEIGGLDCDTELTEIELAELFIHHTTNPCQGFRDGSVDLLIPNPAREAVTVVMNNGIPLINGSQQHPVEINLFGLSATDSTLIDIQIGACAFEFSILLDEQPFSNVFIEERQDTCVYAKRCRDLLLGESYRNVFYDIANAQGGSFQTCQVPIYCGNLQVGERKFSKKTVKAYEYKIMLDQAIASGLWASTGQWYTDQLLARYRNETQGNAVCKKIRYCPANMYAWNFGNVGTNPVANGIIPLNNGCTKVDCKWPKKDYTVCPNNLPWPTPIDELVRQGGSIPNNCSFKSYNFWQLMLWHENGDLETQHPEYIGTELENLLETYQGDSRTKCATLILCTNDFNRIIFNDIETVECPQVATDPNLPFVFQQGCETVYSDGINATHTVVCFGRGSRIPYFTNVSFNLNGPLFKSQTVYSGNKKLIADTIPQEQVLGMGLLTSDGKTIPQNIIKSPTTHYFHNYTHRSLQLHKVPVPGLQYHLEDWDQERTIYGIEVEAQKAYNVIYEDTLHYWQASLLSDQHIKINHFSTSSNELIIGGVFKGNLSYQNSSLASTDLHSIFLLKLSYEGEVINFQQVENVQPDQVVFSENRNGRLCIAACYDQDWIAINDNHWDMGATNGVVLLEVDTTNWPRLINILYGGQDLALKTMSTDQDHNQLALTLSTAEAVELNATTLYNGGTPHLLTLALDITGSLSWLDTIRSEFLDLSKTDLTYGDGDLYLGLTFSDSIILGGQTYHSNGETDIALAKYLPTGWMAWVKTSGSEDSENISQLFYDTQVLYFSGEFSGNTQERTIGGYQFVNYTTLDQRAYLSYERTTAEQEENRRKEQPSEIHAGNESLLQVFPNPFSSRLNTNVLDEKMKSLSIYDATGKLRQNVPVENRRQLAIDFSNYASGIYFVMGLDERGRIVAVKKVVYQP